jgi:hypothetical protein
MKKIALLLTIVCAGQLYTMKRIYGMEPERGHYVGLGDLPREVQAIIIAYLQTNDDLDGTIAAIKEASKGVGLVNKQLNEIVNEVYGIPKGFTALVHVLADKFNTSTENVANKFNTSAAETYVKLGSSLLNLSGDRTQAAYDEMTDLIKQGADVNFEETNVDFGSEFTPLGLAVRNFDAEGVRLLLDSGAKPTKSQLDEAEEIVALYQDDPDTLKKAKAVKKLLEEAMKKQQAQMDPPSHKAFYFALRVTKNMMADRGKL